MTWITANFRHCLCEQLGNLYYELLPITLRQTQRNKTHNAIYPIKDYILVAINTDASFPAGNKPVIGWFNRMQIEKNIQITLHKLH